jgi:hypothetical protein
MRRSSLYLALVRFDIRILQLASFSARAAPPETESGAITASPGVRDQLRVAHLRVSRRQVKFSARGT